MPSGASCTEGGPWESIAKLSWLSTSPRRSTPWRSRKGAGPGKSGFSGMSRTARCRSSERSRDWRGDTIGCTFVLKLDRRDCGLYRQIQALGHDCTVVAPALIPKWPGERIKTNRRDAVTLARLHRAGEPTGVWAPDAAHEAVRDLVCALEAAADDLRRKCQQLLSFLLRHSRIYSGGGDWTMAHRRWLARRKFEPLAQQIVFQEGSEAIEDALQRLRRLEKQLALIVPEWSMAPVVEAYQAMRGASFLVAVTFAAEDRRRDASDRARLSTQTPVHRRKKAPLARRAARRRG